MSFIDASIRHSREGGNPLFSVMNTVLIAIKRIWMTSSQGLSDTA